MTEFWTVYTLANGWIRLSGSGPVGSGGWQQLQPGEALWLVASDPSKQKVVTGPDGQLSLANL